jgi:hypothetical protein
MKVYAPHGTVLLPYRKPLLYTKTPRQAFFRIGMPVATKVLFAAGSAVPAN